MTSQTVSSGNFNFSDLYKIVNNSVETVLVAKNKTDAERLMREYPGIKIVLESKVTSYNLPKDYSPSPPKCKCGDYHFSYDPNYKNCHA